MRGSFVIPSFNSAAWLSHAIISARKQDYSDLEIIVVDDASTDSTQKLMEFVAPNDTRIKYVRLEKNVGRSEARNIGNRLATGKFIMVLDADDIAYPDRAKLTAAKIKSGADFVHGSCDYIDAIGSMLGKHIADVFSLDKAVAEKVNRIVHSTSAYTKDVAMRYPYKDGEAARLGLDDWCMQLETAMGGAKFEHITQIVGAYRDIETGVSRRRDPAQVEAFKAAYLEAARVIA